MNKGCALVILARQKRADFFNFLGYYAFSLERKNQKSKITNGSGLSKMISFDKRMKGRQILFYR